MCLLVNRVKETRPASQYNNQTAGTGRSVDKHWALQ